MGLVTGHAGGNHITSNDAASFNMALFGRGEYVFERGSMFAYNISSNNLIEISNGDALFQGRHYRVELTEKKNCVIENGTQGQIRHDLICIKYWVTEEKEVADIVVVKGIPGTTGADPEYVTGDIEDGATVHHMPLYRVVLNGLNIESVVPLFMTRYRTPNIIPGDTTEPNTSLGEDGDIYLQRVE